MKRPASWWHGKVHDLSLVNAATPERTYAAGRIGTGVGKRLIFEITAKKTKHHRQIADRIVCCWKLSDAMSKLEILKIKDRLVAQQEA